MKKLTADDPTTHFETDVIAENVGRLKALFPEGVQRGQG